MFLDERWESAALRGVLSGIIRDVSEPGPGGLRSVLARLASEAGPIAGTPAGGELGMVLLLMRGIAAVSPEDGFRCFELWGPEFGVGPGWDDAARLGLVSGLLASFCRDAYASLGGTRTLPGGFIMDARRVHDELGGIHDSGEHFGWRLARLLALEGRGLKAEVSEETGRLFAAASRLLATAAGLVGRFPDGRISEYNRHCAKAMELLGKGRPGAAA